MFFGKQKYVYSESVFNTLYIAGVILETEGSVWKIQKRALFQYNTVKKGTLIWPPHMFMACLQLFW